MIHTILGAGGGVGTALVYELLKNNQEVRLVSRSGHQIDGAKAIKADLMSIPEATESVRGSDVVHLCAGLPYDTVIWQETWPRIMHNSIEACKRVNARLIYLDNVYCYGKVDGKMTENTPYNPCSKKGEIRATIAAQLEDEVKRGTIQAIIVRAADWYGPYSAQTSLPRRFVFDPLMKGKKARCLIDVHKLHSYSFTLDCGKGMYLLSTRIDAFNQTWHLPTAQPPIDGKTFIEIAAKELGVRSEYSFLKKWMIRLAGLTDKTVREAYEMLYQSEYDYYVDSSKFEKEFKYSPTPYEKGISDTIISIRQQTM